MEASEGHVDDSSILDLCTTKSSHSFMFLALGSRLQRAWVNIQCIITKILNHSPYSSSFKRAGVQPLLPDRYGIQGSSSQHRNVHLLFNILFHLQNLVCKASTMVELPQSKTQIPAPLLICFRFAHSLLI